MSTQLEPVAEVSLPDEIAAQLPNLRERTQFRALLLANPNYFGNLKVSALPPVLNLQANTSYEAIGCVGYQPQARRLEAVIFINHPYGYGGDICSNGTPEFVRFYLSFDNGATWLDQGLTGFTAYNIPAGTAGRKRLEYAVTLQISPPQKFCTQSNRAKARAILSWNAPPPPNDPDFVPVWGDVHDTYIQIQPRRRFPLKDVFTVANVKLPPLVTEVVDLSQTVEAVQPVALSVGDLQKLYADKGVEPHRFAFAEAQQFIAQPALAASSSLAGLGLNLADLAAKLVVNEGDGNTRYERLECVGLNPNLDTLVGVIRLRLPSGFSGGPCTSGSWEYVTFWGDFDNNGTFETCLGTAAVNVHDFADLPKEGLEYAVFLPVDLNKYRRPCEAGPVVVRIRAILSWQAVPPCNNPNYVPVWGNREETLIHIKPGTSVGPDFNVPVIETVGSMEVGDINPGTGLASGVASLVGFTAEQSPFGGEVVIRGRITNAPDVSNGAAPLKYRVWLRKVGDPWNKLTTPFPLQLSQILNWTFSDIPDITQTVDSDDWYTYRADPVGGGPGNAQILTGEVLARWQTGGLNGLYQIQVEVQNPANVVWWSNTVTLKLDNVRPDAALAITSGGGNCADFTIGDLISGTYSVSDLHFGALALSLLPANGGSFTVPAPLPPGGLMPLRRTFAGGVPTVGEAGVWTLDTSGLPRCGYVIHLSVSDRTIVNSGHIGFSDSAVVGLCLREPDEE